MVSLNSFLPALSDLVGVSPGVLYERQRSLVHLGLLESKPGRGPGSGVRLSPRNVGILLVNYAGTDSLSETGRTERVCAATFYENDGKRTCPITGKMYFLDIVIAALSNSDFAARLPWIEIETNSNMIMVSYFVSRQGARPRNYQLIVPDVESRAGKAVIKRSILTHLDEISGLLAATLKNFG